MRKLRKIKLFLLLLIVTIGVLPVDAANSDLYQNDLKSGVYQPDRLIDHRIIRNLPIPQSNTDYAFIQAIGPVVNIVIGKFAAGDKSIVLITDKNSDGKVDTVIRYDVDNRKFVNAIKLRQEITDEKFLQMKKDIIAGSTKNIRPNHEGEEFARYLMRRGETVIKKDRGYIVTNLKTVQAFNVFAKYFFSYSKSHGADLVFELRYRTVNNVKVKPLITHSVYCSGTRDTFLVNKTKELITEAYKYASR